MSCLPQARNGGGGRWQGRLPQSRTWSWDRSLTPSSTPGRIGPTVARWFHEFVKDHGKFDGVLVDLADFNLPIIDEPHQRGCKINTGDLQGEMGRELQCKSLHRREKSRRRNNNE
jgi:hypothetical protein